MTGEILSVLRGKGRGQSALPRGVRYADVLELYAGMVRVRRLEAEGQRRRRSGEVPFLVVGGGREAILAGVIGAMDAEDALRPMHLDHGAAILRGVKMEEVFGQWLGRATDPAGGSVGATPVSRAANGLLGPSGSATAHVAQAAGQAHGMRLRGGNGVVVALLGPGALDTGDVHAGFIAAARLVAPVLFVVSAPIGGSEAISSRLRGYAMPLVRVDGDDIVAVFAATRDVLARARGGEGPLAMIVETSSLSSRGAHAGGASTDVDPLARARQFLIARRALDAAADHEILASAEQEACTAWEVAMTAAAADPRGATGARSEAR